MQVVDFDAKRRFTPERHVEDILSRWPGGDVSIACWEPGQISPNHCHPFATEIYLCMSGGGRMLTLSGEADIGPGAFVVHPPGEVHEYVNGTARTVLFRVRIGDDMISRHLANRGIAGWTQRTEDAAYFAANPPTRRPDAARPGT